MTEPHETSLSNTEDREELKRRLAYQFWEDEGRPDNRAEAHWEKACLVLMSLDARQAEDPQWLQRVPDAQEQQASASSSADTGEASQAGEEIKSLDTIIKKWAKSAA